MGDNERARAGRIGATGEGEQAAAFSLSRAGAQIGPITASSCARHVIPPSAISPPKSSLDHRIFYSDGAPWPLAPAPWTVCASRSLCMVCLGFCAM
jgi:hypothetical protein